MNNKRIITIIATVLAFSLLCGCASVNVNVKVPKGSAEDTSGSNEKAGSDASDDIASFPQLTSEDYDLSKYDDDKDKYFDVRGTVWSLTKESAEQYPNLVASLTKIFDSEKKFEEDSIAQYDSEAKSFFEDNKKSGYDGGGYECTVDTGLGCADPKVVSLVSTQETFFGGAHPDTVTLTFNLDSQTGEFIPLSDIIKDRKGLDAIMKDALTKQYSDHSFFGLDESLSKLGTDADAFDRTPYMSDPTYVYAFSPNGLTFFFDSAILSPHSDGGEQIDLTYDELSSVLTDKYLHLYD